jgi:nitroreductase
MSEFAFDEAFRARLRDLFVWRRDVRRFRRDAPPAGTLERLIEIACLSPSVGLSQPWRFVIVDDPMRRQAVPSIRSASTAFSMCPRSGGSSAISADTSPRSGPARGEFDLQNNYWSGGRGGMLVKFDTTEKRIHEYRLPTPYASMYSAHGSTIPPIP